MLTIITVAWLQASAPASDVRQLSLAPPQVIADIDAGKLKGDFARLAWSPDGSEFYVQTVERDGRGAVRAAHHYVASAASKALKSVDQEPAWASKYWSWKSDRASPAAATFSIAASQRQETVRSVNAPSGGVMAKGGVADPTSGSTVADVASAAENMQQKTIWTLKVKNETIGEWVNEPVTPGVNFTWAPAPLRFLAFAKRDGGPIVVVDDAGRKQELQGPKSALLPAWSDDGKRIAWLERRDKKRVVLMTAELSGQ